MKESTGGALLMGLAAGIIIIFIIMVAFFISYGKTFRIKNAIINKIEQEEGMKLSEIKDFIYDNSTTYSGKDPYICYNVVGTGTNYRGFTVEVTVYMSMDRTILGDRFNVKIPVRGETRIIEKGNYFNNVSSMNLPACPSS